MGLAEVFLDLRSALRCSQGDDAFLEQLLLWICYSICTTCALAMLLLEMSDGSATLRTMTLCPLWLGLCSFLGAYLVQTSMLFLRIETLALTFVYSLLLSLLLLTSCFFFAVDYLHSSQGPAFSLLCGFNSLAFMPICFVLAKRLNQLYPFLPQFCSSPDKPSSRQNIQFEPQTTVVYY